MRPHTDPASSVLELLPAWTRRTPDQAEASARLWAMTHHERVTAMRARRLTFAQCMEWARKTPGQVPLLNGEWEFIARDTADIAG